MCFLQCFQNLVTMIGQIFLEIQHLQCGNQDDDRHELENDDTVDEKGEDNDGGHDTVW